MEPIELRPSVLYYGIVPVADRPISQEILITNRSTSSMLIKFNKVSTNFLWFTRFNKIIKTQRKTGFDIFFNGQKLDLITLHPQQSVEVSCIILPSQIKETLPLNIEIPIDAFEYDSDYSDSSGDGEFIDDDDEIEPLYTTKTTLTINAILSSASYSIEPNVLFLNNCKVNQTQTRKVTLRNLCDSTLPIMIHSIPEIEVFTPSAQNYISIPPKKSVEIIINHTPTNLGLFEHCIPFDCLIKNDTPQSLRIFTSVSPEKIPLNFPVIHPSEELIDFGQVYAGEMNESDLTIENKSDTTYKLHMCSLGEAYLEQPSTAHNSLTTSFRQIMEANSKTSLPTLYFKTTSMPKSSDDIEIGLDSKSNTSIKLYYTPTFNKQAPINEFHHRSFIMVLKFIDTATESVYNRFLLCSANVCHSNISINPGNMDFGDTVVANTFKSATINISNQSPMPTTVKATSSSRSIACSPIPITVPANSEIPFNFNFYPRKVNPEYTGQISFVNEKNPNNVVNFSLSAIVVAGQKESIHSISYSLSVDKNPINSISFRNVVTSFPAIKELTIKNKTKEPLSLTIKSNDPGVISIYMESMPCAISMPQINSQPSVPQATKAKLLTAATCPKTLKSLYESMRYNSDFFHDMYTLFPENKSADIVDHFAIQMEAYRAIMKNAKNVGGQPIEIPPSSKAQVFVVCVAEKGQNPHMWMHRRYSLSICMNGVECEPLVLPISLNVATSSIFLSARSLNFGTFQVNTRAQHDILASNESCVPAPFRIICGSPVHIDKHNIGIITPLSNITVPFTFAPAVDGQLFRVIKVVNVLNDEEDLSIIIKANVERVTNFIIHPSDIDFGRVTAGICSVSIPIFITNTSQRNNEFTFSHATKEFQFCRPLVMFKIKELSERATTDAMNLQVEKLKRKQKILIRKKKMDRVDAIQRMIDDLMASLKIRESQTKLKQLGAKFLDRLVINAEPLQVYCIELQLIPSLGVGRRLPFEMDLNGTVIVYEKAKTETEFMIKYKAHIVPQPQRILDAVLVHSVNVEPMSFDLGQVYVHEAIKKKIVITNVSNTQQNIWFSATSTSDAIITTKLAEYFLKYNESVEIPFEIFFIQPGRIVKEINITTQTSSQKIPLTAQCNYHDVLSFEGLVNDTIDYGSIPLTTLRILEERKVFQITNITPRDVYIFIKNTAPQDLLIYEKDPKAPLIRAFCLPAKTHVIVNLVLKPDVDRESYHSYKSTVINHNINITVFESDEEASAFAASDNELPDCIFQKTISVKAIIGRIGLLTSDTNSLFRVVNSRNESIDLKMTIKNRSTHIPVTVVASAVQGLSLSDYIFNLEGRKVGQHSSEFSLTYSPSQIGMNEAQIRFTTNGNQPYSKAVTISALVDPHAISTNLPKHESGADLLNVGGIYVQNGKPIFQEFTIEITNTGNSAIRFEFAEIQKRMFLRLKETTKVTFQFPFTAEYYNPQEPEFLYRLICYNSVTRSVIKVIYITGYFAVSTGSIDRDSIVFERFGQVNHWEHKREMCTIINQSKIPLVLRLASTPQYVDVPQEIGPIPANGTLEVALPPKIAELKNVEGEVKEQIRYINSNNINNILLLNISFNISASFIRFENIDSFKWLSFSALPSKAIRDFKEIEGEMVATSWFAVVSTMDVETTISVLIERVANDDVSIELFGRASGQLLTQIVLQPNERFEVRVKATLKPGKKLDEKEPYLADVVFQHEGSDALSMPIVYSPSEPQAENPAPQTEQPVQQPQPQQPPVEQKQEFL